MRRVLSDAQISHITIQYDDGHTAAWGAETRHILHSVFGALLSVQRVVFSITHWSEPVVGASTSTVWYLAIRGTVEMRDNTMYYLCDTFDTEAAALMAMRLL